MKEVTLTVHRLRAGALGKTLTLRPIGGEHPTLRMQGGNRPTSKLTSVSTRYGDTNRAAMPGLAKVWFEKPKRNT
jgi:hypothetical protein